MTASADLSPARFTDVAATSGIHYRWEIAGKRPLNILQTIGNGCAFLDYDNDGNLDILLIGPHLALYRGDGHGHFTDVTRQMGLSGLAGHFLGCAVGDYDNDGYEDIYLSGYRTGLLLHNDRGRCFSDVTRQAGLKSQPWGTSCAWAETVPGSGRLDLFVANYARFGTEPGIPQLCDSRGVQTSCGPREYTPLHGVFYRNLGNGRFATADQALDLTSTQGRGLGAAFAPLYASGPPSLVIANDELPGDLLDPVGVDTVQGRGRPIRYANIAPGAGVAYDRDGNVHGGMGADWGDYDNDGRFDLFVSTFHGEVKSLYHNDGNGLFSDASYLTGIAPVAMSSVAFGCKFFDFDNDGALDLIIANGHVQDNIDQIDASVTYRQKSCLLHNRISRNNGNKQDGLAGARVTFEDLSAAAGSDLQRAIVGRGLAVGDYDNDGREDVLIVDSEGSPLLLHNETVPTGHWLGVQLRGTHSNRDGIGAVLTATVRGRSLTRLCHTDGSYLSASDRRVHFGLGAADHVDTLIVRWPDSHVDRYKNLLGDRYMILREGSGGSR
jgi:enediyne biosynthesis protein E4